MGGGGVTSSLLKTYYRQRALQSYIKIYKEFACDIQPHLDLSGVIFRHPLGIVLGGGAVFGKGVIIHQGVTLGASHFSPDGEHRGVDCKQIIGDGTILCTGAKVLGDVTIGKNCVIGANAVVTRDVPEGMLVVGFNQIVGPSSRAFRDTTTASAQEG